MKYAIEYVIGLQGADNQAAIKGSITHRAYEILGKSKLAIQNGESGFQDDELGYIPVEKGMNEYYSLYLSYAFYTNKHTQFNWETKDSDDCLEWLKTMLYWQSGAFDIRTRKVIGNEIYFDIPILKEWAYYNYSIHGQSLDGFFGIKGTIDCLAEIDSDTLEIIDIKTGRRWDWGKDKKKEYIDIKNDIQFNMYHYAARHLFPQYKVVQLTAFYTKIWDKKEINGGPYTVWYDPGDYIKTENRIKEYFETIKKDSIPQTKKTWKCKKFCWDKPKSNIDNNKTVCDFLTERIKQNGLEQTMLEYGKSESFSNYGGAAGRDNT